MEYLRQQPVDLIFLDLNLPKLKGFDFLRSLPHPPKVIVTTAYQEFALEGYELNIVDYLLKPFSFERFLSAVNKSVDYPGGRSTAPATPALSTTRQSVFLKSNKVYLQVILEQILYLEASGNYTRIVSREETITVREKISELLPILRHPGLLQVHKSFAVAKQHIKRVAGNRIQVGDHEIPVGKTYRALLLRALHNV